VIPKLGLNDVVIQESGQVVWKNSAYQPGVAGLSAATDNKGEVVLTAGSGAYDFELTGI
jgi:hypothetical protein